jgi:hypothetical protein
MLMRTAARTAVFDLIPNLLPFFTPGEWSLADNTKFGGEVLFQDLFQWFDFSRWPASAY